MRLQTKYDIVGYWVILLCEFWSFGIHHKVYNTIPLIEWLIIGFFRDILGSLHEVLRFNKVLFGPEDLRSCAPSACCLTTETVVVAIKVEAFGWLASDTPGFFQGCYKFIIITASWLTQKWNNQCSNHQIVGDVKNTNFLFTGQQFSYHQMFGEEKRLYFLNRYLIHSYEYKDKNRYTLE